MRKWLRVAAIYLAVHPFVLLLGMVVHEGAHVAIVVALGAHIESVAILPGLQIYPRFELVEWQYWVAIVSSTRLDSQFQAGLVAMSGSLANAVAAYVALGVLYQRRTGVVTRVYLLSVVFVLGLDIVTYTVLPPLGLRHWGLVGGARSETLEAARDMAIPIWLFVAATLAQGAAIIYLGGVQLRAFLREIASGP